MLKLPNHILALSIIYIYYMIFNMDNQGFNIRQYRQVWRINTNKYGE